MNYYNPYYMMTPMTSPARPGLFGLLSRGAGRSFSLSSIINGTQKTLGLVNQAIPIVKQVTPIMRNAKTMFKVMNEFKKVDTPTNGSSNNNIKTSENAEINEATSQHNSVSSGPTFFV